MTLAEAKRMALEHNWNQRSAQHDVAIADAIPDFVTPAAPAGMNRFNLLRAHAAALALKAQVRLTATH
jgi:hypothetical protein